MDQYKIYIKDPLGQSLSLKAMSVRLTVSSKMIKPGLHFSNRTNPAYSYQNELRLEKFIRMLFEVIAAMLPAIPSHYQISQLYLL